MRISALALLAGQLLLLCQRVPAPGNYVTVTYIDLHISGEEGYLYDHLQRTAKTLLTMVSVYWNCVAIQLCLHVPRQPATAIPTPTLIPQTVPTITRVPMARLFANPVHQGWTLTPQPTCVIGQPMRGAAQKQWRHSVPPRGSPTLEGFTPTLSTAVATTSVQATSPSTTWPAHKVSSSAPVCSPVSIRRLAADNVSCQSYNRLFKTFHLFFKVVAFTNILNCT